jgi:hypothetical protein
MGMYIRNTHICVYIYTYTYIESDPEGVRQREQKAFAGLFVAVKHQNVENRFFPF